MSPAGTSNPSTSVSYAPIIGGVVGGLAFILGLGGLFLFLRRRRRQQYSGNTVNLPAGESAYPNLDPSSRLMSQAPRSMPFVDDPFRIDPILPDAYTSPSGPSALPRPSISTYADISSAYPSTVQSGSRHGRGHSVTDSTLWSVPSAQTVATIHTDSSSTSLTSTSAFTASLPSRSRRRPPGASTRKQPHSRSKNVPATEDVEAPPAYEDIDTRDDSMRVEQASLTGRAI
ncbi:hypothetical protein HETIRDRAFT_407228 [Heterobasidion irregulare TC 32-1]|uniref:Uncharacterized protein n=1 Tax=Heterobasidion irregulare (strain TC 32-1) TaxID=747525 RepID=W4KRF8_HETIT|nr:uncharacterized protein HETIRDRAFT_407228 [Heterobasidion irregulare TC 32-1]ETW87656.1 hypothetical protein HETIRDRAFT_407228 [Heterobasidion irregulare TC 32-1]